jgi:hypothetical protein
MAGNNKDDNVGPYAIAYDDMVMMMMMIACTKITRHMP